MLDLGIKFERKYTVQPADTCESLSCGGLAVLSLSAMAHLMEVTACASIEGQLAHGTDTASTSMKIKQVSYVPVGSQVRCNSELVKLDGKNLTFAIKVQDDFGIVGTCVHERSIVDSQYFMMKAMIKKIDEL